MWRWESTQDGTVCFRNVPFEERAVEMTRGLGHRRGQVGFRNEVENCVLGRKWGFSKI